MEEFVKGHVPVVPFLFSDLSDSKKRPVPVVATPGGDDIILCRITGKNRHDRYSVELTDQNFIEGGLKTDSYIRPDRIFTADKSLILYRTGSLKPEKRREVEDMPVQIITK